MSKQNGFIVSKVLNGLLGTGHKCTVKSLRSGLLLIEVDQKRHAEALLKIKAVQDIPVTVEKHNTLNMSKGIVHCDCLDGLTNEEIQMELADQGVTEVFRFKKRDNGIMVPTSTFVMTFERSQRPTEVKIGYINAKVTECIPNPRRCFNC